MSSNTDALMSLRSVLTQSGLQKKATSMPIQATWTQVATTLIIATMSRTATDEVIESSFHGYPIVSSSVHPPTHWPCASRVCRCCWNNHHIVEFRVVPEIYITKCKTVNLC